MDTLVVLDLVGTQLEADLGDIQLVEDLEGTQLVPVLVGIQLVVDQGGTQLVVDQVGTLVACLEGHQSEDSCLEGTVAAAVELVGMHLLVADEVGILHLQVGTEAAAWF